MALILTLLTLTLKNYTDSNPPSTEAGLVIGKLHRRKVRLNPNLHH